MYNVNKTLTILHMHICICCTIVNVWANKFESVIPWSMEPQSQWRNSFGRRLAQARGPSQLEGPGTRMTKWQS
jgi:hypothetical protein